MPVRNIKIVFIGIRYTNHIYPNIKFLALIYYCYPRELQKLLIYSLKKTKQKIICSPICCVISKCDDFYLHPYFSSEFFLFNTNNDTYVGQDLYVFLDLSRLGAFHETNSK